MDYCHPCRRHLNGALACPGCGAPAEQLPAYPSEEDPRPAAYAVYEEAERAPEPVAGGARAGGRAAARRSARGGRGADIHEPGEDAPEGASRRDRKAAAHRRRRRRTLLVTAGFLLAGGGLSLAELGLDAPGSSPAPAAAGDASTDGGAEEEAVETAEPISDTQDTPATASPSTSASPSPSQSESESAQDTESEQPEDRPTKDAQSSATGGAAVPETSQAPEPTTQDPEPTPTADPTTPEPEPDPVETCTRFLWWCG
ncbi:SCO2400 family protein [Streptomyces sp. NPDC002784]